MKNNLKRLFAGVAFPLSVLAAETPQAPVAAQGPGDPQIAAIVMTANNVDIAAGKMAKSQTKDTEIKMFAEKMVVDHSAVNKSATDLASKLKLKPEESDTSRGLKKSGDEAMLKMKSLKGKDFDKAYVDNEVTYHQVVLDAIDNTLIPSAKSTELKNLLNQVRPNIAAHLDHAKHLQSTMK